MGTGTIVTLTSTRMPEYKSKQRHMNKCKCIRERRFNWPKRKNNVMSRQQPAAESEDNTINCTYYVCVCEWVGIVLNQIMSNGVFIWQRKCVKNKRIPFELVPGWKDVWCATLMRTTRSQCITWIGMHRLSNMYYYGDAIEGMAECCTHAPICIVSFSWVFF